MGIFRVAITPVNVLIDIRYRRVPGSTVQSVSYTYEITFLNHITSFAYILSEWQLGLWASRQVSHIVGKYQGTYVPV